MKRSFVCLVALAGVSALPAGAIATSVRLPARSSSYPLYCIPPAKPPAAAHTTARADVAYLSTFAAAALAAKGSVKLPASTSGPGTVKVVLAARNRRHRTVVIGSGNTTAGAATCATTVELVLSTAGKALMEHRKGPLRASLTITFTPTHGRSATAKDKVTLK